jgi:hypothetical protein
MSEIRKKILTLFDPNREGPLTDQELKNIKYASFPYLLEDGDTGNMALLLNKLIDMIEKLKKEKSSSSVL